MKLLISGTTGFIGKNLVKRLLEEKHTVFTIVRPSSNPSSLEDSVTKFVFDGDMESLISFMQEEKIDGVIHLASLFLAGHKPDDIKGLIESNVLFGTQLLEASVKAEIPWFINTGTFWQHYENKKYSPVNLYAATKQAFEDIAKYYTETSNINFVTIKLSDTFGPFDTRPKIFNLWTKISQTKEKLGMSPGKQIIDISHIDNITDAYLQLIKLLSEDKKNKLKNKSFAIHSNERVTLRKLSKIFEELSKTKLNINWGEKEYRLREVMKPWTGGDKIPGWKVSVKLRDGIKKMFNN